MTDEPEIFDCFLCHNSADKPRVRALARELRARRVSVWLDDERLRPGIPWQTGLEGGIRASKAVAVLVGSDGFGPWESAEMQAALDLAVRDKRPVIPVLLADAPAVPKLPLFLSALAWVDLRSEGESCDSAGLDRLVWGITGRRPDLESGASCNDKHRDERLLQELLRGEGLEGIRLTPSEALYRLKPFENGEFNRLLYPSEELAETLRLRRIAGLILTDPTLGIFMATQLSDKAPTLIKGGLRTRKRTWERELADAHVRDYVKDETPVAAAIREFHEETGYVGEPTLLSEQPVAFLYAGTLERFAFRWGWVTFFYASVDNPRMLELCRPKSDLLSGRWYHPGKYPDDMESIKRARPWQQVLLLESNDLELPWGNDIPPTSNPDHPGSLPLPAQPKESALRDFLADELDPREMRTIFQELPQSSRIAPYVSLEGPPIQVATELVDVLGRRGAIDSEFFQTLLSLFPARAPAIRELWERWEPNPESWSQPPSPPANAPKRTVTPSPSDSAGVKLFVSYSRRDKAFFEELQSHLTLLIRQGVIDLWSEGRISAGAAWKEHIERAIAESDIFVLLLGPEFFASEFSAKYELDLILARQHKGASVIPVLVRPALIPSGHPILTLSSLPRNGMPLSQQDDTDDAWLEVYEAIRAAAQRRSASG